MNKESLKKGKKEVKLPETFLMDELPGAKISVFFQTIVYTLISIAIFGALGHYLDKKLDTAPVILITALVISYPITQIILFRKFRMFAKSKIEKVVKRVKVTKSKKSKSEKKI